MDYTAALFSAAARGDCAGLLETARVSGVDVLQVELEDSEQTLAHCAADTGRPKVRHGTHARQCAAPAQIQPFREV